jgi:hypothetical protein
MINGTPAKDLVIVFPSICQLSVGLGATQTLPAGRYTPVFEDESGVYFQSPGKILTSDFVGVTLLDGGLYLRRDNAPGVWYYAILDQGFMSRLSQMPGTCTYSVERVDAHP